MRQAITADRKWRRRRSKPGRRLQKSASEAPSRWLPGGALPEFIRRRHQEKHRASIGEDGSLWPALPEGEKISVFRTAPGSRTLFLKIRINGRDARRPPSCECRCCESRLVDSGFHVPVSAVCRDEGHMWLVKTDDAVLVGSLMETASSHQRCRATFAHRLILAGQCEVVSQAIGTGFPTLGAQPHCAISIGSHRMRPRRRRASGSTALCEGQRSNWQRGAEISRRQVLPDAVSHVRPAAGGHSGRSASCDSL